MKKATITAMVTVLAILCVVTVTGAADVSASLDLASAYVFRGYTLNDALVIQPGIEVSGPVTVGVWANMDTDDYTADTSGQFSEIDLYASYDLPIECDTLGLSIGYTEYTYPSASGGGDADREILLSTSLDVPLAPTLDIYYGVDGAIKEALYVELGFGHTLAVTEEVSCDLSATLAYLDPKDGESGFSHANLGAAVGYKMFSLGVTYIAQLDDEVLPDTVETVDGISLGYDVDVVVTLGISADF